MSQTVKPILTFIDGPVGALESLLEQPKEVTPSGVAVVCHPHPLHGGTMQNKVAHTLARAFLRLDFAVLRFNFRGTGRSEGDHDGGRGEVDDVLAALAWIRQAHPGLPAWLSGFSFGAAIAVRAAVESPVSGLVSVAPAVSRFVGALPRQPDCPWYVIQGDADELVDINDTVAWLNDLGPGPELFVMPGAEHFFHGRLNELREAVMAFVVANR